MSIGSRHSEIIIPDKSDLKKVDKRFLTDSKKKKESREQFSWLILCLITVAVIKNIIKIKNILLIKSIISTKQHIFN